MQRRSSEGRATRVSAAAGAVNALWQDGALRLDLGALAALTAVLCGFQGQEVVTVAHGADAVAAARAYEFAGIATHLPTWQLPSGISPERHAHWYALGHHYRTAEAQLASRLGIRLRPMSGPRGVRDSPPDRWEPSPPAHIAAGARGCAAATVSVQEATSNVQLQQLADIIAGGAHRPNASSAEEIACQLAQSAAALSTSPAGRAAAVHVSAHSTGSWRSTSSAGVRGSDDGSSSGPALPASCAPSTFDEAVAAHQVATAAAAGVLTAVEAAGCSLQVQPPADKMQVDAAAGAGCSADLCSSSSNSSGGSEPIHTAVLQLPSEPDCGSGSSVAEIPDGDDDDDAAYGFWSCGSGGDGNDAAAGEECWEGGISDDSDVLLSDWASMCSDDG